MEYTKTELHTHLAGMLTAGALIGFIKNYTEYIYWPLIPKGNERLVKVDDLINNEEFLNSLRIKQGTTITDYDKKLDDYYRVRELLVKFLVQVQILRSEYGLSLSDLMVSDYDSSSDGFSKFEKMIKQQSELDRENAQRYEKEVFNNYFNRCLNELVDNGVKYVEISYANPRIISHLEINEYFKDKIDVKVLLASDRGNIGRSFEPNVDKLDNLLNNGLVVGFDIMGEEEFIDRETEEERYNVACMSKRKAKGSKSLRYKLEILVKKFHDIGNEDNVLRIHSGETKNSMGNTEWILETLKDIKNEYKSEDPNVEILPPPILRIGHAIRFNPDNERYLELLKEFDATIEINISSNIALNNIDSLDDLPLEYYVKNKIPLLLSTDGHGLYDTSIKRENLIVRSILKERFNAIIENEKNYINKHK